MKIEFEKQFPWALLPCKPNKPHWDKDDAEICNEEFRWLISNRVPERCAPWRIAQQLGYIIRSPITCTIAPFIEYELAPSVLNDQPGLDEFIKNSGVTQLWERDGSCLGIKEGEWLKLYSYRQQDKWVNIFIPNGQGSVEWHLGFNVIVPNEYFIFVMPYHLDGKDFEIPLGVIPGKTLTSINQSCSFSITIKPLNKCTIRRNMPIARIILLHKDSICE